jgi:hypothetical protein
LTREEDEDETRRRRGRSEVFGRNMIASESRVINISSYWTELYRVIVDDWRVVSSSRYFAWSVVVSRAFPLKLAHPEVARFGNTARCWGLVIGEFV